MEKPEKKNDLKCYEKILNGIIAVNIGAASIPVEELSSWGGFLNAWERFQRENKIDIARMIRQFGASDTKAKQYDRRHRRRHHRLGVREEQHQDQGL